MKTTNDTLITAFLGEIYDCFGKMCAMTRQLLENFSPSTLEETLQARSRILGRIEAQKFALSAIAAPAAWTGYSQYRDIQNQIGDLKGLDHQLTMTVTRRMYEIKRELAALTDSSHVAKAYARYSRG
jgi:hypothetical protein